MISHKLTPIELRLLTMLHMSNKEIANQIHLSSKTIELYISNIFQKLNVKNRTAAYKRWVECDL